MGRRRKESAVEDILATKIRLVEGGKSRSAYVFEAIVLQLLRKAQQGDVGAASILRRYCEKFGYKNNKEVKVVVRNYQF